MLLKVKALFQVFVIVFSLFSVSLLVSAEQNVCCSETTGGEHCVYTSVSNCKQGALQAAASCEQTSFCKLGCGYDDYEGSCFNNMPKFSCEAQGNCSWTQDPICNVPQCQKGCCVLSNQCSFTTQVQCKWLTSQYEDINMTFKEEIGTELECINQCRSFERGACVHPDGSCDFTTRESCDEEKEPSINASLPLIGFHTDRLCSNPSLGTECARQHHTDCMPDADEVYWFDSCGNEENIYSSDKDTSWNNGFILNKFESCNPSSNNINSETCGNCNYALGSICDVASYGVDPVHGDYACKSLICGDEVVHVDENSPATSELPLDNGESWCAYDGLVGIEENAGMGLDLAGSRHYRRICINGIELTEPCRDFREEICVQGEIDPSVDPALQLIYGTQESFGYGGDEKKIFAGCRDNRFTDCVDVSTKYDCENIAQRDCLWLLGDKGKSSGGISCVPLVSPGLTHWSGESSGKTSGLDPKATCEKGNTECTVYYHRPGIGIGEGGRKWKCVGNCECLEGDYLKNANAVCKSLGDCGAWYNIAGKPTCEGFVDNLDEGIQGVHGDPDACDEIPAFGNLKGYGEDSPDEKSGFEGFWKKAWWGVGFIVTQGIVSWSLGYGFLGGMAAGFPLGWKAFTDIPGVKAAGKGAWEFLTPDGTTVKSGIEGIFQGAGLEKKVAKKATETVGKETTTQITKQAASKLVALGETVTTNQVTVNTLQIELTKSMDVLSNLQHFKSIGVKVSTQDLIYAKNAVTSAENSLASANAELVTSKQALTEAQSAATPPPAQFGPLSYAYSIISFLMTAYTIYTLLDTFLASDKTETITVNCNTWQAPVGGSDCDECQEDGKECSEYRCKSLGQMCALVNEGTSDEKCVSMHPNDVVPPYIAVDKATIVHKTDSIDYENQIIEVKGKGFEINKKIAPFTAVTLAVTTNEYAQCKFDVDHNVKFDDMAQYFGDSVFRINHTMTFSLPGVLAEEELLDITNGGEYQVFIKCQDGNGNKNEDGYYAKFTIDDGPDFTAPVIEMTSIPNEGFVSYGTNETVLSIFVNEPANCNWDDIDVDFDDMYNSFSCKKGPFPSTSLFYGLYECTTIIDGLENGKVSSYYFGCEDQPNKPKEDRNVNSESYVFKLQGTYPLEITSVYPKDNIELFTNSPVLKVVTSGGAHSNGVSICGYNFIDPSPLSAIDFLNTDNSVHEQPFFNLTADDYTVYINCIDIAGNVDDAISEFTISVDTYPPVLLQSYTDPGILHIVMDEASTCEYSVEGEFTYGSGIQMTGVNTEEHTASLEGDVFYIGCEDLFENIGYYVIYI